MKFRYFKEPMIHIDYGESENHGRESRGSILKALFVAKTQKLVKFIFLRF